MHHRTKRIVAIVGSMAAVFWIAVFAAGTAHAGNNVTEAGWLGADADVSWITVEVLIPGRGPDSSRLMAETKATFAVHWGGTGYRSTSVLIDGETAELSEIPEGETVRVFWRPVEGTEYELFATKILYITEAVREARKLEAAAANESQ